METEIIKLPELSDDYYLTKMDNLYLTIDSLGEKDLDKIIKYIGDQKLILGVIERRKSDITNEMRVERIKMRKELNATKEDYKKTIQKKLKIKEEFESESLEEVKTQKKKIQKK